MLKVLIVDDEPLIREGLKSIVDWSSYGFSIIGEAENGKEGLVKTYDLKPDLLIVDVKMPEMSGLQMVEELRRNNNECKVILLSAYSDFNFAQKAIELSIDFYLLKPIEESELIMKLCKIHKDIMNNIEIKQNLDVGILASKERILECIALGQISTEQVKEINQKYGFDFPWYSYQILLIEVDKTYSGIIDNRSSTRREVECFIKGYTCGCVFNIEGNICILLKNISLETHFRLVYDLQKRLNDYCGIDVIISVGYRVDTILNVHKSYKQAHSLLENKFVYRHKKIIAAPEENYETINEGVKQDSLFDFESTLEKLYNAIDANNMNEINDLLETVKNQFMCKDWVEQSIKINYTNLYVAIVNRLVINNASMHKFLEVKSDVLNEIHKKSNLQELHGFIKYKLISISDELSKLRPTKQILKVIDYINRNYNKDLRLECLSELFNYNSAYLGMLFKSHTGISFNSYLEVVRLEKAKQFLKEGLKVYQVAERTGYNDINYFYKKFKKYVGVSPLDFKAKNQQVCE